MKKLRLLKPILAIGTVVAILASFLVPVTPALAANPGAIWTTNSTGTKINENLYDSKSDVWLNGGPQGGGGGLPDGSYYVQVTEPAGALLGFTLTAIVQVLGGKITGGPGPNGIWQLEAILVKASNGDPGYDTSTNGGGVYKVWVSQDPTFPNSGSKTDNFKVKDDGGATGQETATLNVIKFYDANANGINDDGQLIPGWKVSIDDVVYSTPVSITVNVPGTFVVSEFDPNETDWVHSTATEVVVNFTTGGGDQTVAFGNYCLDPSGGLTLGFWSNKNGQAKMNDAPNGVIPELALLSSLNLRDAIGSNFHTTVYATFRTWILGATATNMAYMLSAQLAAMELNVEANFVNGNAFYIPAGMTITQIMAAANLQLGANPLTTTANDPINRGIQETLKNYLDALNNGALVVPPNPCPFSFP